MKRTTIDLDQEQYDRLVRLAEASGRSLGEVVRDALNEYLVGQPQNVSANGTVTRAARLIGRRKLTPEEEADWRRRFEELVARIHARIPDDVSPEEIERDITLASAEARFERIARRAASESRRVASD